jgi:hypothetical protein
MRKRSGDFTPLACLPMFFIYVGDVVIIPEIGDAQTLAYPEYVLWSILGWR